MSSGMARKARAAIFAHYSGGIDVLVFNEVSVKGGVVSKMPVADGTVALNKAIPRTVTVTAVRAPWAVWWVRVVSPCIDAGRTR